MFEGLTADLVVTHGYAKLPVDKRRSFAHAVNKVAEALGSTAAELSWDTVVANAGRATLTTNERELLTVSGPRVAEDLVELTNHPTVVQYV